MSTIPGLPPEVDSAMFLRDGWPHCCVCKITMKDGRVGIGVWRNHGVRKVTPEQFDQMALMDAMNHVADDPPDYTEIQEHAAKQANLAALARADAMHPNGRHDLQEAPETDEDLQASLGQKAHD